jgi:hypothetical protein
MPHAFIMNGHQNRRAGRETVQGAAGQSGDDVHVAGGDGEVSVNGVKLHLISNKFRRKPNENEASISDILYRRGNGSYF